MRDGPRPKAHVGFLGRGTVGFRELALGPWTEYCPGTTPGEEDVPSWTCPVSGGVAVLWGPETLSGRMSGSLGLRRCWESCLEGPPLRIGFSLFPSTGLGSGMSKLCPAPRILWDAGGPLVWRSWSSPALHATWLDHRAPRVPFPPTPAFSPSP